MRRKNSNGGKSEEHSPPMNWIIKLFKVLEYIKIWINYYSQNFTLLFSQGFCNNL